MHLHIENGKAAFVDVDMGEAVLKPAEIPMNYDDDTFISKPITVDGKEWIITAVSMGNPHAVLFTDNIDELDLENIGPSFENHPIFPERVNTEFCEIIDKTTLKMRVWERGSGETWACGTGACATAVAAVLNGYCNRNTEITLKLRGGDLRITYRSNGRVIMCGPAETVFTGEIDV